MRCGARRRGAGPTTALARADPPVPRSGPAHAGSRRGEDRRRPARPRPPHAPADARRERRRACGDAGRRSAARVRLSRPRGRGDAHDRESEDRRSERRDRGRRRGLPLVAGRARPGRTAHEPDAGGEGRKRHRASPRAGRAAGARRAARARPPRRHAGQRAHDRRGAQGCARHAAAEADPHRDRVTDTDVARIAVAATAPFGADVLERLAARHEIAFVLTRPDAPSGRGRALAPSPAKVAAERLGLHVLQPPQPEIEDVDTVVVVAYGLLIPSSLLERALWLNVHPSLLPRWRGAAPVERAIMADDATAGVTIHRTVAELD